MGTQRAQIKLPEQCEHCTIKTFIYKFIHYEEKRNKKTWYKLGYKPGKWGRGLHHERFFIKFAGEIHETAGRGYRLC